MWAVPFQISFAESDTSGVSVKSGFEWLLTVDAIVDFFFWCDILLNFRITYRERGTHKHVKDPYSLAYNYATTWFVPDLLSVLPFASFFGNLFTDEQGVKISSQTLKLIRILRFVKMTKLVRLLKLGRLVYVLEDRCGCSPLLFSFGYLLATVFLVIHLLASVFYLCTHTLVDADTYSHMNSWVISDEVSNQGNVWSQYISAMYWSCTTITTVGYGDITPKSDGGRVFVFFAMVLGAFSYGYIIAAMGTIISDLSASSSMQKKRMTELSLFMDAKGLPSKLRSEIRESYRFWLDRVDMFQEEKILEALPQNLRETISKHYAHKIFANDGFFVNAHPQFVADVLPMLHPILLQPYSTVLFQGDIAESMYILTKGILSVDVVLEIVHVDEKFDGGSGGGGGGGGGEEETAGERGDERSSGGESGQKLGRKNPSLQGRAAYPPPPPLPRHLRQHPLSRPLSPQKNKEKTRAKTREKATTIATLLAGSIFGEMAILCPEQKLRRNATVQCQDTFCEVFRVDRNGVVDHWLTYPTVRAHLLELTEKRVATRRKMIEAAKSKVEDATARYWSKITQAKTNHIMLKTSSTIRLNAATNMLSGTTTTGERNRSVHILPVGGDCGDACGGDPPSEVV